MLSDNNVSLAGSNEDSVFPLTLIWFVPASEKEYARICLGYKMISNSVQGGMNEKGLFVDGNSLSKQNWKKDENKQGLPNISPGLPPIPAAGGQEEDGQH